MRPKQRKRTSRRRKSTKRHRRSSRRGKTSNSKFVQTLRKVKSLPNAHKYQAMRMANNNFVRKFCVHVKKLKHKKLRPSQRKVLAANRSKLRKLANSKVSLKSKRKMLTQRGGFLPALIPLIASVAAPALQGIVGALTKR